MYTIPKAFEPYDEDLTFNHEYMDIRELGVQKIQENKICVIILAGGQGTRLGSNSPKGLYKLPHIDKTIFELHCSFIQKAQETFKTKIKLLIMTSSFTHKETEIYFKENKNFGLDVILFQQENSICFDFKDKPLQYFDDQATSPNGNGVVFRTLAEEKIFSKIYDIKYCCIISVDNILACPVDPILVGHLERNNLKAVSKCVQKRENENTGVFVKKEDYILVLEYSEAQEKITKTKGYEDECEYANICNHMFTQEFMQELASVELPAHKAIKKIPYTIDGKLIKPDAPNGYKTELFIFDALEYTKKSAIVLVPRELEFSPVKNGMDVSIDNPETAVRDLMNRNRIFENYHRSIERLGNLIKQPNIFFYADPVEPSTNTKKLDDLPKYDEI